MSVTISSSNDLFSGVVLLPNPDLGNEEGRDISVEFRQSMNGEKYSYVKSNPNKTFSFTWSNLDRDIIIQVQEFFKQFAGDLVSMIDFRGVPRSVIFAANPIDSTVDSIHIKTDTVRRERGNLTLEFLQVS